VPGETGAGAVVAPGADLFVDVLDEKTRIEVQIAQRRPPKRAGIEMEGERPQSFPG
jgi:hypothetical protein